MQKTTKNKAGRKKRTHMSGDELQQIQTELKFAPRDMRAALGGLNRRTYEDYTAGRRGIPAELADKAREILERNRRFMADLPARIRERIDREFGPGGRIPSEPFNDV